MPDIDIDFSVEGRDKVIDYVAAKYGRDRVAQIGTFGTIKARQAVRDAARVMDVPYGAADRIAKLIPEGPKVTLTDCLKPGQELHADYEKDSTTREVVDAALQLEGLIRQESIRRGVVISDRPLTDILPLQQKGDAKWSPSSPWERGELGVAQDGLPGPAQPRRHCRGGADCQGERGTGFRSGRRPL